MTKPTIVTRTGKGSPLSIAEGDSNFTNLRDATVGVLASGVTVTTDLNGVFEIEAGTGIAVVGNNTSKKITISKTGSNGIVDVVEDTSPQLGGDLDVQTNKIVSTANRNIWLAPDGTGKVKLGPNAYPSTIGSAGYALITDGAGVLSWAQAGMTSLIEDAAPILGANLDVSTYKIITSSNNRNIELDPHGTGVVAVTGPMTISGNLTVSGTTTTVNSTTVDIADKNITLAKGSANKAAAGGAGITIDLGSDGQAGFEYVQATDRFLFDRQIAGSFFSNAASNFSGGTVNLGSNANVTITGGSSGQVLRTDGAGALTWVNQSSGPADTDALTEGVSNFYFTTTRARAAVSGTGSISYNSSTGVFSYTGTAIPSQTGNSGKYLTTDGSSVSWATVTGGMSTLSSDTTPSLGGDLNLAGYKIKNTTASETNIETYSSIWQMNLKANKVQLGYADSLANITTNGSGNLKLDTNNGANSSFIQILSGVNGNIGITPNGTGKIMLNGALGIQTTSGTPSTYNTSYFEGTLDTPASWLKIEVGGNNYYLPMFQ